jgi:hypothetical protein
MVMNAFDASITANKKRRIVHVIFISDPLFVETFPRTFQMLRATSLPLRTLTRNTPVAHKQNLNFLYSRPRSLRQASSPGWSDPRA